LGVTEVVDFSATSAFCYSTNLMLLIYWQNVI
jgi:hypothetical protein